MKLSTFLVFSTASLVLAAPAATIEKRADFCGQYESATKGSYIVYNNLWGEGAATSGSQCSGINGLSNNILSWHTSWTWAGGSYNVKSYANAVPTISQISLSSTKSLASTWTYTYTGTSLVANVAYDLFTSSSASGSNEYEIMVWLAALGGAGPLSTAGKPVATVTLAASSWNLYSGKNGQMTVFSFVAATQVKNFNGDLMDFFNYLTSKQGLPTSQILKSIGAGTEVFTGSGAKMATSAFSLVQKNN